MEDDYSICWSPTLTAILLRVCNPWHDAETTSSDFSSFSLSMLLSTLASHILTLRSNNGVSWEWFVH